MESDIEIPVSSGSWKPCRVADKRNAGVVEYQRQNLILISIANVPGCGDGERSGIKLRADVGRDRNR